MDQNYSDQFWSFGEKKTGGSANAISVWESKEPWAEGARQDMMTEFQSSIEQDAISKIDTRISSYSGFMAATSGLAKKHDASTQTLKPIDRADHVQASADLKEIWYRFRTDSASKNSLRRKRSKRSYPSSNPTPSATVLVKQTRCSNEQGL
jgi:hypothetical protein